MTPHFDLNGKSILVTGGTGSFGKAFVASVLRRFKPARLVIFSRDELKQFEMAKWLNEQEYPCLRYFIGDVRDQMRLEMAMSGIDYVVHAAALKQVSIAEYNPFECIHTNVVGAENVVRATMRTSVKKVIALSTDKAANPINLYGASKLAADKIFIAANHMAGATGPRFSIVRYGNVLGSRGSVVPLFQELIDKDADHLPVTHEEMTRFWILLGQAVNVVISSFAMMQGGEIYVPKIPSMRLVELARALAPDVPIKIIGIRPGEKVHEVMVSEDDARLTVEYADRYAILPAFHGWNAEAHKTAGGKRVPDTFRYASNTNSEWMRGADITAMLGLSSAVP